MRGFRNSVNHPTARIPPSSAFQYGSATSSLTQHPFVSKKTPGSNGKCIKTYMPLRYVLRNPGVCRHDLFSYNDVLLREHAMNSTVNAIGALQYLYVSPAIVDDEFEPFDSSMTQ